MAWRHTETESSLFDDTEHGMAHAQHNPRHSQSLMLHHAGRRAAIIFQFLDFKKLLRKAHHLISPTPNDNLTFPLPNFPTASHHLRVTSTLWESSTSNRQLLGESGLPIAPEQHRSTAAPHTAAPQHRSIAAPQHSNHSIDENHDDKNDRSFLTAERSTVPIILKP